MARSAPRESIPGSRGCRLPEPSPEPTPACEYWRPSPRTGRGIRGHSRSWHGRRRPSPAENRFRPNVSRRSRSTPPTRWCNCRERWMGARLPPRRGPSPPAGRPEFRCSRRASPAMWRRRCRSPWRRAPPPAPAGRQRRLSVSPGSRGRGWMYCRRGWGGCWSDLPRPSGPR